MVTKLEIQRRETVLGGKAFGAAGAYEKLAGTIHFSADPKHPLHAQITDIDRAPTNANGEVKFAADFFILKPVDTKKGNKRLFVDVPNRGRKVALGMYNSTPRVPDPTTAEDFGNGFLMGQGYTVAWVGWQIDVPRRDGLMALEVPRAEGVTGVMRCELRPHTRSDTLALADRGHIPNRVAKLDDRQARLFRREHAGAKAVEVPRSEWSFPDAEHVALKGGFTPGVMYDVIYASANPPIVGLSFLAVRDIGAFLRWGTAEQGNPCAGDFERAYLFGVSQSGRFLRQMLFLGLDENEQGRMVYDAVMPHVAGGRRGEFNIRLGQPSLNAKEAVSSLAPFNDEGVFAKLRKRGRIPKVFLTNTSAEYWRGEASLIHTDLEGARDAEPADFVHTYLFSGTQHTPGAIPPLPADPNTGDKGVHRFNVTDYSPLLRSALVNLDQWASKGVEPPKSAFPRLSDKTAVEAESLSAFFTSVPGVKFPERIVRPHRLDFGPEVDKGLPQYPPKVGEPYRTYVSAVDVEGNEVAGVKPVETRAPLATFAGWNPRAAEQGGAFDVMPMMGSTFPLPKTRADRERTKDPRKSIEERYPSKAAYLERVREVTREAIASRHVLADDLEAIVDRAGQRWDWVQSL